MNFDFHNPATWFVVLYGAARVVSHLTPSYTVVGRFCSWVLGHVTPTDTGGVVSK